MSIFELLPVTVFDAEKITFFVSSAESNTLHQLLNEFPS